MNNSSTNDSNKTRSSPSNKKAAGKRRQRSRKGKQNNMGQQMIPVAMFKEVRQKAPNVKAGPRSFRIQRNELVLGALRGGLQQLFVVSERFRMNPGSKKSFPWLSQIASSFESYKFHKLMIHFITRVPTTTPGSLYISPDYDAADAQPSGEIELANNVDARESPVYKSFTVTLKPERMNRLYKSHVVMDDGRFGTTKQDQKTIDVAQVFFASDTNGGNLVLGKVWIEYDVEFYEPQVSFNLDIGGMNQSSTTGILQANSANPLLNAQTVFIPDGTGPNVLDQTGIAYPSNILGKFTKDWEGFANLSANATAGISSIPRLFKNGTVCPLTSSAGTGQNNTIYQSYFNAIAGDILTTEAVTTTGALTSLLLNGGGLNV